jgi:ABC transport system ATP-binding/permease protein
MNGTTVACEAAALEVVVGGRRVTVAPTQRFVLGRGADADLALDHPRVSRRHLILEHAQRGWTAVDHSRNGTFNGGARVSAVMLTTSTTLSLGGVSNGQRIELYPRDVDAQFDHTTTTGSSGSEVVLDDLLVSRRHARLECTLTAGGSPTCAAATARS